MMNRAAARAQITSYGCPHVKLRRAPKRARTGSVCAGLVIQDSLQMRTGNELQATALRVRILHGNPNRHFVVFEMRIAGSLILMPGSGRAFPWFFQNGQIPQAMDFFSKQLPRERKSILETFGAVQ